MFHDATSSGSPMNEDSQKPIPPLTAQTADGKPYTRFADVEAEIRHVWGLSPSEWVTRKAQLKNETLAFLVRKGGVKDDYIRGELHSELNKRTIRISKSRLKAFDHVAREEISLEVEAKVFTLLWSETDSAQADFLEVAFAAKVRDITNNAVERYKHSVMGKSDSLDVWTGADAVAKDMGEFDPVELRQDVADLCRNPEEILLLIEDESRRDDLYQQIIDAVKDPRHFQALYLFYAQDHSLAQIAAHFKATVRQIREWKSTALHQVRAAFGIESEEKREALKQLRRLRRAKLRSQAPAASRGDIRSDGACSVDAQVECARTPQLRTLGGSNECFENENQSDPCGHGF